MKRRLFTLVEMLVVIGIIGILAGIAIPVVLKMKDKGKETQARADINAIMLAIKQYEADYGTLPWISKSSPAEDTIIKVPFNNDEDDNKTKDYNSLMQVLTTMDKNGNPYTDANPKRVRYLDLPVQKIKDVDNKEGFFKLDPWKRRYCIFLDTNYDGKVTVPGFGDLMGKVFIYSYGAGDKDLQKNYITSWKTSK